VDRDNAYLASKNDYVVDSSCGLFPKELMDDVIAEGTSPDDCEVLVSRHVVDTTVRGQWVMIPYFSFYLCVSWFVAPPILAILLPRLPRPYQARAEVRLREEPSAARSTRVHGAMRSYWPTRWSSIIHQMNNEQYDQSCLGPCLCRSARTQLGPRPMS
jgi:hypothetical protein